MKKYFPVSRSFTNKSLDSISSTTYKITILKSNMLQLKTMINLTDNEIKVLENAINILNDKVDILENLLEDKNITFFND
jgi:putative ubiquitin-RnfH superfamily antitoxin RatB of RatAB toxin-antitoxin module